MTGFANDLRYALRSLARRPGLAAAAIATLALGIGANVAVFSVVDGLMLRPLPVRDPSSLALLTWSAREWPKIVEDLEGSTRKDEATGATWTASFPYPAFETFTSQSRAFSRMFAVAGNDIDANVQAAGRGASATTKFVSGSFFDILGVRPARGRPLLPADDRLGRAPVAVVSDRFWRGALGGNPSAVGRPITVNGRSVLLVGVLPAGFFGLDPGSSPDLWMPLHTLPAIFQDWPDENGRPFENSRIWWLEIGGSVAPGRDLPGILQETRRIFDRFLALPGGIDPGRPILSLRAIARGEDWTRHRLTTPLLILLGLSALVLAVACTNVAGLLLARATARNREIAIRRSLGANTARLVRQLLTESVVLAFAASAAALLVADGLTSAVLSVLARTRHPLLITSPMNARVLLFGLAAAGATGVLAGLVPAWRISHSDLTPSLREAAPVSGGRGRMHGSQILVAAQVALGLVLVTAAGLFARTLANLRSVDLGFRPDHVALFSVRPGLNGYAGERLAGFYDELRRRLETIPGVRSATLALHGAVGSGESTTTIDLPGSARKTNANVHLVGPRYFETLRIPVLAGRPLGEQDRSPAAPTAVVNDALARQLFPNQNPVGRSFATGRLRPPVTIVGVVGNVRYNRLREAAPPTFYLTYRERPTAPDEMMFHVRSVGDTRATTEAIREIVASLDPNLPVVGLQTQEDAIEDALSMERVFAILTGSFAVLALLLAAIGLYAALAFSVARRTREIGVRIALGATPARIRRGVVRDALIPTAFGLGAGIAASVAFTRVLKSQLFGLSALDPAVLIGAAAALLATAALAAWLPARRASSVDPMTALRTE